MMRLCYASIRQELHNDLLQDLSDILAAARNFNQLNGIHGVLYYAEDYFFQCLEGDAELLEKLYAKIERDPRHHQLLRFANICIEQQYFKHWSMKYVNRHSAVSNLFTKFGLKSFLPHQLTEDQIPVLLEMLHKLENDSLRNQAGYKNRGYQNFF
ncbi:BLUF domain-containing protein [Acinetobacter tianfuensis]|uniref:BLUF domain-containing protein n=1 Tax=Acinetobacter tianfuensis TaxID=2419603 RepID=A0A3A8EJP0_9GAMM|nr:BLUF domain-containing protein [Acinetobacter tianfuensis]RKG30234.1 BLUF domain-containing protein [Acinetobacter tianfuensis]